MKKLFYSLFAALALFTMASCSEDEALVNSSNGDMVSFTVTVPEIATRAAEIPGGGKLAQTLAYAVYTENGDLLFSEEGLSISVGTPTQVNLKLARDNKYNIVFWADSDEAPYYIDWKEKTMSIDYNDCYSNDETMDAFYAVEANLLVTGPVTKDIKLKRPFAQLNIGSSDLEAAALSGVDLKGTEVVVDGVYKTMNLLTGEVEGDAQVVTYKMADRPAADAYTFPVAGYEYLALNYILVNHESENYDVKLNYDNGTKQREYANVPMKRNYRTNIYGQLITADADFNVSIDPIFEGIENMQMVSDGIYLNNNGEYVITEDKGLWWFAEQVNGASTRAGEGETFAGKTFLLAEDIDLEGAEWTPIGNNSEDRYNVNFRGTFDGQGHVIKNFKVTHKESAGLFGYVVSATIKNIVVENATINSNHYAGAIVGWAESGGTRVTIEGCTVKNSTITTAPELIGEKYDNGDKAGAIIGFAYVTNLLNNNVEDVTIRGYRDLGGITGIAQKAGNVTGNSVKNVTIIVDQANNYKGYTSNEQYNAGEVAGRIEGEPTIEENTTENVVINYINGEDYPGYYIDADGNYIVTENKGINAAIEAGATELTVAPGEYPALTGNDIKSAATINCEGVTFTGKSSLSLGGATINGATFYNSSDTECAATGTINGTFNNCTFVGGNNGGIRWSYTGEEDVTFTNCTIGDDTHNRGFHADGSNGGKIIFEGCTIYGFTAIAGDCTTEFRNCQFPYNKNHNVVNMYGEMTFVNCEFNPAMHTDCAGDGVFATLTGCTYTDGSDIRTIFRFDKDPAKSTIVIDGYTYEHEGLWKDAEGNYVVSTASDLYAIAKIVNTTTAYTEGRLDGKVIKLACDIDMNGAEWVPIGDDRFQRTEFRGIFDGQNHTISNFKITQKKADDENKSSYGFIGNFNGTVKNLTVSDVSISNVPKFVGALVGRMNGGLVDNCHVKNSNVIIKNWTIGGLVGQLNDGKISNSTIEGTTVTGYAAVGGIVGVILNTGERTIENCKVIDSELVQNGSYGGDWDKMFGAMVGSVHTEGLTVYLNNCTVSGTKIKNVDSNTLYGFVEDGSKVYVDGLTLETITEGLAKGTDLKGKVTYQVSSANGLVHLSKNITIKGGESVVLTANIDLKDVEFNGLNAFNPENNNTFDGGGHTVSNWTNESGSSDMGFIKNWVGTIKNVTIEKATLKTSGRSAVVAAKPYGNIENCHVVNCSIEDTYWSCGAIAGQYNAGSMKDCSATGTIVKSNGGTGGIVGVVNETAGTRSFTNCDVKGCTITNTGIYGEAYSGAAVAGMINVSGATITFDGCDVTDCNISNIYGSGAEDNTVTVK